MIFRVAPGRLRLENADAVVSPHLRQTHICVHMVLLNFSYAKPGRQDRLDTRRNDAAKNIGINYDVICITPLTRNLAGKTICCLARGACFFESAGAYIRR
jgi:hypothetical protein